jgi:tRNA threonylcarbamoyladenosine biosynthesis protein TsaB
MNILAIEASTTRCSVAIVSGASVAAEVAWEVVPSDHQGLFRAIAGALRSAGVTPADIGCFAVDTGPGRFTGLRTALAAARGMALPGKAPVVGIDSGAAMAWQAMRLGTPGPVAVAGDARRARLWLARFEDGQTGPRQQASYACVRVEEVASALKPGDRIITADWPSLSEPLTAGAAASGACLDTVRHTPQAATVGLLASLRLAAAEPSTASITYLMPPV